MLRQPAARLANCRKPAIMLGCLNSICSVCVWESRGLSGLIGGRNNWATQKINEMKHFYGELIAWWKTFDLSPQSVDAESTGVTGVQRARLLMIGLVVSIAASHFSSSLLAFVDRVTEDKSRLLVGLFFGLIRFFGLKESPRWSTILSPESMPLGRDNGHPFLDSLASRASDQTFIHIFPTGALFWFGERDYHYSKFLIPTNLLR